MKQKFEKAFIPNLNLARKRINDCKTIDSNFELSLKQKKLGKNKKYFIRTYGCQSNVRDSETMSGILEKMGFSLANDIFTADLVILNTCAIRENAEKKVFGEIGLLKKNQKNNPNFIFGITGCMAQEEKVINKIIEKINHINFVIGTHNIHELPNIIEDVINNQKRVIKVYSKEGDVIEKLPSKRNSKIKAFVNVMYGCDNFCTYCIVPYTRGKIRSRSKENIINEVNELIKKGYKEVTLIGQNVNSYGIDFKNINYRFKDLLEDVAKTKISRIRFTTSNPWNFNKKIIDVIKKNNNIMPYFHLPIQSGNEEILKRMNRSMKIDDYIKIINEIRNSLPHSAISTDIIVGFPNETNENFLDTIKLYNEIKFDNAYTFIYSPREGTPAATYKDEISLNEKQDRLKKLNELVKKYAKENNLKWVNKVVEVLVEGKSKNNKNLLTGYSPEWKVVNFIGNAKIGDIVKVKIVSASRFSLNGEQL